MVISDKHQSFGATNDSEGTSAPSSGGSWLSTSWLWSWKPTSLLSLQLAENQLFSYVKCKLEKRFVEIKNGARIWTVICGKKGTKSPLVMVHGFGGGVGLWVLNYTALSQHRQLYAFDVLGFGQSSRPPFPTNNPVDTEEKFVESIEEWREKLEIDDMILLGHSFGGYLSTCYALKYPHRVKSLILADPWGFPECDPNRPSKAPLWIRCLVNLMSPFNPLALVRAAGPFGPGLVKKLRSDFREKFQLLGEENESAILEYIYHCNAAYPSGESGFKSLSGPLGYAGRPLLNRIGNLDSSIEVTFIYGARSWMDLNSGRKTQSLLKNNNVQVFSIKGAGHHVYADRPQLFHQIVNNCLTNDDVTYQPDDDVTQDDDDVIAHNNDDDVTPN